MMTPFSGINVGRIARADWPEAARLLVSGQGQAAQWAACALVDRWSADQAASQQLFGAFVAGRLVAAAWIEPLAGRSAILWPPRETGTSDVSVLRAVLGECRRSMASGGISLAQSLLKSPTPMEHALLIEIGFARLNDLFYLFRPVVSVLDAGRQGLEPNDADEPGPKPSSVGRWSFGRDDTKFCDSNADADAVAGDDESPLAAERLWFGNEHCDEAGLQFVEVASSDRPRLASIVEDSYRETLDFPQLNGWRGVDEVLESYESIGASGSSLWRIIRFRNEDVGCLFLADHPEDGNLELVYMGVRPRFRGMGWGKSLVAHACRTAVQHARQRVVLAVDAGNEPALRIYRSSGFSILERRAVYVWRKPD